MNSFEWRVFSDRAERIYNDSSIKTKGQYYLYNLYRCVLISSIFLMLGGVIGSILVLILQYVHSIIIIIYFIDKSTDGIYPGVALILQSFLIAAGAGITRWGSMAIE